MMVDNTPATDLPDLSAPVQRLCEILLASITALAATGEVEQACRLAGQACVTLRRVEPISARRFDVLLHRLTPRLTGLAADTEPSRKQAVQGKRHGREHPAI